MIFTTTENKDNLSGLSIKTGSQIKKQAQDTLAKDLKTDMYALQEYANGIGGAANKSEFFEKTLGEASQQAKDFAPKIAAGTDSAQGFKRAQTAAAGATTGLNIASKAAASGIKILNAALNMGAMMLVAGAIQFAVEGIMHLVNAQQEAIDKVNTLRDAYETSKSNLETINNELKTTQERIGALNAKDKLTFAEQGELDKLQSITKELLLQQDIAKRKEKSAAEDLANGSVEVYNKQFGENEISQSKVDGYITNAKFSGNNANLTSNKYNISSLIAAHQQLIDKKKKAVYNKDNDEVELYNKILKEVNTLLFSDVDSLLQIQKNIELIPLEERSKEQQLVLDKAKNGIELIYKSLDPDKLKTINFDSIVNSKTFANVKTELSDLAKQGKLTAETLNDPKYKEFKTSLTNAGLSVEDVVNQLNALNATKSVSLFESITSSLSTFDTQAKSAQDNIFNLATDIKTLNTAIDENNKGTLLDGEAVAQLIFKYPELQDKIIDTGEGYKFQAGALEIVRQAQINQATASINAQINDAQQTLNSTKDKLGAYSTEIQGMKSLADAKKTLAKSNSEFPTQGTGDEKQNWFYKNQNYRDIVAGYQEIENAQKRLDATIKGFDYIGSNKSKKADNSKSSSYNESSAKTATKSLKEQYEAELKIIEANKAQGKYDKDKMSYLNTVSDLQAKWSKTALDSETKMELSNKVYEARKSYQEGILSDSYKELENRKSLGIVQANSKEELQNLLEIQKNLNSSSMSLVNTEENQLELQKKIYDVKKGMLQKENEGLEKSAAAAQSIADRQIKNLQRQEDALDKEEKRKQKIADKHIKDLQEEEEQIEKSYQTKIDAIQKQIDALKDVNQEHQQELALQKAQAALEQAKSQKTVSIYHEGRGFVYEADTDAIKTAQEDLSKTKLDKEIFDLENNKKKLEDSLDSQKDSIQDSIKYWENYKEKIAENFESQRERLNEQIESWQAYKENWSSVLEDCQYQQDLLILSETLGAMAESEILSQRLEIVNTFKDKYIALQKEMADYAAKMAASAEKAQKARADLEEATDKKASAGPSSSSSKASSTSSPAPNYTTYTIKPGDNLSKIASENGISLSKLLSANSGYSSNSIIYAGNKLKIPKYASGITKVPYREIANVDEIAPELIIRKTNRGRLTKLEYGEGVIPDDLTKNLLNWGATTPQNIVSKIIANAIPSNINLVNTKSNSGNTTVQQNFDKIVLPNVTDGNSFLTEIKHLALDAKQRITK